MTTTTPPILYNQLYHRHTQMILPAGSEVEYQQQKGDPLIFITDQAKRVDIVWGTPRIINGECVWYYKVAEQGDGQYWGDADQRTLADETLSELVYKHYYVVKESSLTTIPLFQVPSRVTLISRSPVYVVQADGSQREESYGESEVVRLVEANYIIFEDRTYEWMYTFQRFHPASGELLEQKYVGREHSFSSRI